MTYTSVKRIRRVTEITSRSSTPQSVWGQSPVVRATSWCRTDLLENSSFACRSIASGSEQMISVYVITVLLLHRPRSGWKRENGTESGFDLQRGIWLRWLTGCSGNVRITREPWTELFKWPCMPIASRCIADHIPIFYWSSNIVNFYFFNKKLSELFCDSGKQWEK